MVILCFLSKQARVSWVGGPACQVACRRRVVAGHPAGTTGRHPHSFRTRSELCSALCSALVPHLFRTCSELVPHLCRTCAALVPHLCRTCYLLREFESANSTMSREHLAIAQCSTHRTARRISNVVGVVVWTRRQTIADSSNRHCELCVVCCVLFATTMLPCNCTTAQKRSHHASGHWARACVIEEKHTLRCAFDEKRRLLDLVTVVLLECCLCVCCCACCALLSRNWCLRKVLLTTNRTMC